jgi:mannose-6-phosphate isomerase-like protein (cupin superfamily)
MTTVKRNQVQPFCDDDGAIIRELAAPSNSALQRLSVAEIVIKAGQGTSVHHHNEIEEVYYIVRGSGVTHLNGRPQQVGPGDTIIILPGTRHQLQNTGHNDLLMIVICAPPFSVQDTCRD